MSKRPTSPLTNYRNLRSKVDMNCKICRASFDPENSGLVECNKCQFKFHNDCVGVTDRFVKYFMLQRGQPWYCFVCDGLIREQVRSNMDSIEKLNERIVVVESTIQNIDTQIDIIKAKDATSKQILEAEVMDKVDKHLTEFAASFSNHIGGTSNNSNNSTEKTVANRRKNLMIRGVPQTANEDVPNIIKKIAKVINFNQNGYIDNCFRVSKRQAQVNDIEPCSILLKLNTEIARDAFIKCYFSFIKSHQLTPGSIGLVGDTRIFVNEPDPKAIIE